MNGYNVIQLTAKANESLLSKYENWDEDGGTGKQILVKQLHEIYMLSIGCFQPGEQGCVLGGVVLLGL